LTFNGMITTGMGRLNEFVQTVQNCTHGLELWDLWPKKAVLLMFTNPMAPTQYYWAVIGGANCSARVYGWDDW